MIIELDDGNNFNRKAQNFFDGIKTMVSGEDVPQQTNPMICWMWYHMPMVSHSDQNDL